jgi:hypothetical protein
MLGKIAMVDSRFCELIKPPRDDRIEFRIRIKVKGGGEPSRNPSDGYRFAPPILRATHGRIDLDQLRPEPQNFQLIGHAAAQGPDGDLPDDPRAAVAQPGGGEE